MSEFIPRGNLSLLDAVEHAQKTWYPDDIKEFGLTPEQADLVGTYRSIEAWGYSESDGVPNVLETTPVSIIESLERQADFVSKATLRQTWSLLVGLLSEGILPVSLLDHETGETVEIPPRFWGSKRGQSSYEPPSIYPPWKSWVLSVPDLSFGWDGPREGVPFVSTSQLDVVLSRITDDAKVLEDSEVIPKSVTGQSDGPDIPADLVESEPPEQTRPSGHEGKPRSKPRRGVAESMIHALYPNGVPGNLTGEALAAAVNEKLPKHEHALSTDTVLRAAGRRKK